MGSVLSFFFPRFSSSKRDMAPTPAEKAAAEAARKAMDTYAAPEYWDNRYAETACEPYDWYVKWSHLKDPLKAFKLNLAAHSQVLVAGCGTSSVCEDLVLDNVPQVTNFDRCKPLSRRWRRGTKRSRACALWRWTLSTSRRS